MSTGYGPRAVSLLVVLLMLGCGLGGVVPSWNGRVSATNIPPTFASDWTVSGVTRYDGGSSVLTGNLTIQSGGNLVLNGVVLNIAGTFDGQFHVDVKAGGVLRLFNSTIKANSVKRLQWFHSNGTLEVLNSTVRDFGLLGKFDGVNLMGGSATLRNSTFASNDLGLRIANIVPSMVGCNVFEGLDAGLVVNMTTVTATKMMIENNHSPNGWTGGVLVGAGAKVVLYNSTISANYNNGISIMDGGTVDIYNSSDTGQLVDYYISYGTLETNLTFYNTKHGNAVMSGPGTTKALMHVKDYYYVNISATWESDSTPVGGADCRIYNTTMDKVFDVSLDGNGVHNSIPLLAWDFTNVKNNSFNPYTFNVTGQRDTRIRYDSYNSTIDKNKNLNFDLDDVPPLIKIVAPVNGSATNATQIEVKCMTEPGAKAFINHTTVTVDDFGYFKATYYLLNEGPNYIPIEVQDDQGNSRTVVLNITRDTTAPVIHLLSPIAGGYYNSTSVPVIGSTEPGATVKMNGDYTPILLDGTFNLTRTMVDGPNTLTITSTDKVHNTGTLSVSFTVDLLLPYLKVLQPTDWSGTRNGTVLVSGTTEEGANLTVNGAPVAFTGTGFNTTADLAEGLNLIKIKACDKAHNCALRTVHVTKDSIAPKLTVTVPPSSKAVLTNSAQFTVKGTTEPGAKLTINGQATPITMSGNFSELVNLVEGLNNISIRAEDSYGNFLVIYRNIVKDSIAPAINITSPKDRTKVKEHSIEIEGTIEAGAILTFGGQPLAYNGTLFFATVPLNKEGQNTLTFIATDAAGNSKPATISIERDTRVNLVVNSPLDGSKTKNSSVEVSGYTDSKATVNINGKDYTADASGRFSVKLGLKVGSNDINIKATDDLGNTNSTTVKVDRQKVSSNPMGGMMLWVVLIIIILVIVAVVALLMLRKGKKKQPMPVDTQAMLDAEP